MRTNKKTKTLLSFFFCVPHPTLLEMDRTTWCVVITALFLGLIVQESQGASNTSVFYPAVVRDFNVEHPEFERYVDGKNCGTVEDLLGDDRKPVRHGGVTVTGKYLDGPCSGGSSGGAKQTEYFQVSRSTCCAYL